MSRVEESHFIKDSKGSSNFAKRPDAYDPFVFTGNDNKKPLFPLLPMAGKSKSKAKVNAIPFVKAVFTDGSVNNGMLAGQKLV